MTERFGIEIPSVEHPSLAATVLDEARMRGVAIARLSQGSGLRMLTDGEIEEMLGLAHGAGAELFLFTSTRNSFDPLSDPHAGDQLRGEEAFEDAQRELVRCAELGVDGVLVPDLGLLATGGEMRARGELRGLKLKSAAAIAPQNAATAELYERLGATSINVSGTLTAGDLAAMRQKLSASTTIDIYVESPMGFGGGLRYREAPTFVRTLAPVMLKIGIRNAQPLYPYGRHLEPFASDTMREKVRRAALLVAELRRAGIGNEEQAQARVEEEAAIDG